VGAPGVPASFRLRYAAQKLAGRQERADTRGGIIELIERNIAFHS
jgi:hypothetical protein